MPIVQSTQRISARRLAVAAERLLEASTLCAIATADASGRPHINTAYFAWTPDWRVVWLSDPGAKHSRNLEGRPAVAVAVYDSRQTWGKPDRGIQLFGRAAGPGREARGAYEARFPTRDRDLGAYRLYEVRARTMKLFDEEVFGAGTFVTARVRAGRLEWVRTDVYRAR
jgi:uncharacterized protein YhbP (UPF0306 family)